jgi:hypothetical protein
MNLGGGREGCKAEADVHMYVCICVKSFKGDLTWLKLDKTKVKA